MNRYFTWFSVLFFVSFFAYAQNVEPSRLATIQYGTETEITVLIQSLRTEGVDYLDNELAALIETTRNQKILSGILAFFGEREKGGLEGRAIRIIDDRDYEVSETVLSAIDYLGRVKSADAVLVLMELLDTQERRFMSNAFRALGRASSANRQLADETADFLTDYYNNRNPGDDNSREIIIALGETRSANAVPLLVDLASNTDERMALRIVAIEALSKIGDPAGLDAILFCVSTNDPNVRSTAVAALGPFSGEEVDNAILDAFRDSFYRTRIAAAQASRERRLVAAVPYLQFRAERDEVPNVKDEAIRALGTIANDEAITILENLFTGRRNSDRVRLLAAEMLMVNDAGKNLSKVIVELDEAKLRNQTVLANGFLKIVGEARVSGDTDEIGNLARRFLQNGSLIEKLYGLDMAANNNLTNLSVEIIALINDRNESLSNKAKRTAERLGLEI